jgi:hypothetical protein
VLRQAQNTYRGFSLACWYSIDEKKEIKNLRRKKA